MAQSFLCDFATEYGSYSRKVSMQCYHHIGRWLSELLLLLLLLSMSASIHVHFSGFIVAPVQHLFLTCFFAGSQAHIVVGLDKKCNGAGVQVMNRRLRVRKQDFRTASRPCLLAEERRLAPWPWRPSCFSFTPSPAVDAVASNVCSGPLTGS